MSKLPEAPDFSLSRRQLMWLTGMSTLGLGLGIKVSPAFGQSDIHAQIDEIGRSVENVQDAAPDLAGFKDTAPVIAAAFGSRSDEDTELLLGRLYNETYERLRYASTSGLPAPDFSEDNIKRALSGSLPTRGFDRDYFDNLLLDTKARVAADPSYQATIAESAELAKGRVRCSCTINGHSAPCWLCIVIIVIIIVIVLL
jgi:hypothetical protein